MRVVFWLPRFFLFSFLLHLTCKLPSDPNVPENASPKIKTVDGRNDSLFFNDGEIVLIQVELFMMRFMDSVAVSLGDSAGNPDTLFFLPNSLLKNPFSFKVLLKPGLKKLKVISFNQQNITRSDSVFLFVNGIPARIDQQPVNHIDAEEGERVVILTVSK